MSYQAPHPVTPRACALPVTIDELVADPARAKGLILESIPELLAQVASRMAALKTLEGALLSLMLSQRHTNGSRDKNGSSGLLTAPELAKLRGVPESWVREQARPGNLPSFKLEHYVRFRIEEVERFLTERAN